ncbi:MAG: hypothetical protein M1835_002825, partial [Candelina submexicana]
CAECTRRGRPCVNLSWASLDKTRSEYQEKVIQAEREVAQAMAKLVRLKTVLRQAEERAKQKTICLIEEMEANNELEDPPSPSLSEALRLVTEFDSSWDPAQQWSLGHLPSVSPGQTTAAPAEFPGASGS